MQAVMVLDLNGALRVEIEPRPSHFDRWFDCRIHVDAHPFSGTVVAILTDEDLVEFADALDQLSVSGEAVLGGGRACEMRLQVDVPWEEHGTINVECSVTPSGDDPFPLLRFIVSDVEPFAGGVADRLRASAATSPWPGP